MRTLIALAAITVIAGCAVEMPDERPPAYAAPNKLASCSVGLPQDWKDQLSRNETKAGSHEQVTVVGVNDRTDTTLVKTTRNKTTELVLRDGGKRQQVMALQDEAQLFGVEFDGRWVTFSTTPNPANHTLTTYAWDSRMDGAPVRIGDKGAVVHNGKAAWSDGKDVHLYDLAKKKDKVVGQGTTPTFFGELVIWAQGGKFRAVELDGTEASAPQQLENAAPGLDVTSDGRTLVWTQGHSELHGWRADWPAPRKLAEIKYTGGDGMSPDSPAGEGIGFARVGGDFVSWRAGSTYVTDIRSGATVHTTESDYSFEVRGGALTRSGWRVASFAPLSSLSPLPAC